jgi:hypothetical protein
VKIGESCCDNVSISPEATIVLMTRVSKIGKLLGNVEMDVYVERDGPPAGMVKLFSVRHIKYIDMGLA